MLDPTEVFRHHLLQSSLDWLRRLLLAHFSGPARVCGPGLCGYPVFSPTHTEYYKYIKLIPLVKGEFLRMPGNGEMRKRD